MYVKDGVLYKALYCGLCKSLGGCCGQRARMALSYDMTFLSALLHNLTGKDVRIERRRCVLHPFVPRNMAADDDLTRKVACLNAALAYYKASDDVEDEGKGRFVRAWMRGGARRAQKLFPETYARIAPHMQALRALEKENCAGIDRAADPFALLIADLSDDCLGEAATEHTRALFYGIGKWVYLIERKRTTIPSLQLSARRRARRCCKRTEKKCASYSAASSRKMPSGLQSCAFTSTTT